VHFFPNNKEEIHLINLISKTRSSIDIAMFTINNVRIAEEIKNLFNRQIKLRIITDSECIKMPSSNIYSLAAMGISIKTDDSIRYHMHHKFCVIDNSVVVTGSFNWTDQAVNHNQENLLFLENKDLARQYSDEFQRLWDDFEIEVTKEIALFKIKEIEDKKKAIENRKKREKEKKLIEKENKCGISNNSYEINNYTQNKRNGFFNQENLPNNNYDMYQQNNHESNEERLKDNRNSSCFIF
jgi:phosphatidylserine/phosphatidylglycerophosphate/cardiolipin synthase-like enzyme